MAYVDSEESELMRVVGRIMAVMCVASGTVAIPIVNMAVPVLGAVRCRGAGLYRQVQPVMGERCRERGEKQPSRQGRCN